MKISELKGKAVIGMASGQEVGTVAGALVNRSHDALAALVVKGARRTPDRIISIQSIRAIGPDAVTIEHSDLLRPLEQVPELAGLVGLDSVVGNQVLTPEGRILGQISDVNFDPSSYRILSYEYRPSGLKGLLGARHEIPPEDVIGLGQGIVTVKQSPPSSRAA